MAPLIFVRFEIMTYFATGEQTGWRVQNQYQKPVFQKVALLQIWVLTVALVTPVVAPSVLQL